MKKPSPKKKPGKKPEEKSKSLVPVAKTKLGRPCSICLHLEVNSINSAVAEGKSFRAISRQISNDDSMRDAIRRHTENCLNLDIHALLAEKKIDAVVDHYQEIRKQLDFAKELQAAAREWLTDPLTGRINLSPRAEEVEVIYLDGSDLNRNFDPKRKKQPLQAIIDLVQNIEPRFMHQVSILKIAEMREYALKTIDIVDTVLDKFAKVDGHYQKEKDLEYQLTVRAAKRVENIIATARERDKTFQPNVKRFALLAAQDFGVKPEDVEKEVLKRMRAPEPDERKNQ